MKIIYTRHAAGKLNRPDIEKFKITKKLILSILKNPEAATKTKYGDKCSISEIKSGYDLRIVYDIIKQGTKIITFHISEKGRYR